MTTPEPADAPRWTPGLDDAQRLLRLALAAIGLSAAVVLVGPWLVERPPTEIAKGLARRHPTLVPAGRPERAPASHRAIRTAPAAGLDGLVPEPQDSLRPRVEVP